MPTVPVIHDFYKSRAVGKAGEAILDGYFARWYSIEVIPPDIELRIHADRVFIRPDGSQRLVEYKTEHMASRTGRLFIEVVANDVSGAPGWIYTSQADVLVWYFPETGEIMAAPLQAVRDALPGWRGRFSEARAANPGYNSVGLLVPVSELRPLCEWTDIINEDGAHKPD